MAKNQSKPAKPDETKSKLLMVLTQHVGRSARISERELFQKVYGEIGDHDVRRPLRSLINRLRRAGTPIVSSNEADGGGYWIASAGSELADYCGRLRGRAMRILRQEADLRKMALPELLGQIQFELEKRHEQS